MYSSSGRVDNLSITREELVFVLALVSMAISNFIGIVAISSFLLLNLLVERRVYLGLVEKIILSQVLVMSVLAIYSSGFLLLVEDVVKVILFVAFISSIRKDRLRVIVVADIMLLVLLLTIAAYPFLLHHGRFQSIFSHPNHLAYFTNLLMVVYVIFGCAKVGRRMVSGAVIILLSNSSGGVIVFLLLLVAYFYKNNAKLLILLFLAAVFTYPFFDRIDVLRAIVDKVQYFDLFIVMDKADNLGFGNEGSFIWRVSYWVALLNEFALQDWIYRVLGMGVGTMSHGNYAFEWMITDPHNDYVRVIMERGYVGAFVYFSFFAYLLMNVNIRNKGLLVGVFLIPMFVGNILTNLPYMLFFVYILSGCFERRDKAYG